MARMLHVQRIERKLQKVRGQRILPG